MPMEDFYPEKVLKFCPRCAGAFSPVVGSNSLKCGACGFHMFYNPATATGAIIRDPEGRILLTKRAHEPVKGTWDVPGGFVSPLETAEDCIRREIEEELGIELAGIAYFASVPNRYLFSGMVVFTTDIAFLADLPPGAEIRPADDVDGYKFFEPEEVDLPSVGLESARRILELYLIRQRGAGAG